MRLSLPIVIFLAVQGHSRSLKVIDFGTNRKRIYDFLLVINCNHGPTPILHRFLRYGDLLAENCVFFLPLSFFAPSLPMFPLEFRGEVNHEETRVMGYLVVKVA